MQLTIDILHVFFIAVGTVAIPYAIFHNRRKDEAKARRPIITIEEIKTDEKFQLKTSSSLTSELEVIKAEIQGKWSEFAKELGWADAHQTCELLETELINKLNNSRDRVIFTSLREIGLKAGTLLLNFIKEGDDINNSICFCRGLNRIVFKTHGALANHMRIYACIIDYSENNKQRKLKSLGEPIRLKFGENGKAELYCSEATSAMQDALCDIRGLNPKLGVDEIDFNNKFFHYKKITFLTEVVSVFDYGYDCQMVIESRRNRTIFYTKDLSLEQRREVAQIKLQQDKKKK